MLRNCVWEFRGFKCGSLCYFMAIASSATILRVIFILKDIGGPIMYASCLLFYGINFYSRIVISEIGERIGHFDLQHHKKLITASIVFHIAISLAALKTTMLEPADDTKKFEMLFSHLGLGIISGISTTEFLVVLTGGFRSFQDTFLELNTARPDSDPIIECKICLVEFSAFRVPRILKKCGHTICERCADTLLKQENNQRITCPACQTVTEVYGSASKLVTNWAVLEFVEGIKME